MLLQKETASETVHIKAYSKGKITLNVGTFTDFIFLQNNQIVKLESSASFETIDQQLLDSISTNQPEVIVIGTGETHRIMDVSLIKYLNDKAIAVEAMASRQACHTYEVLSHDKRQVNALIFA